MKNCRIASFLILIHCFLLFVNGQDSLRQVHVLFRHGDRAPGIFLDETQGNTFWPDGTYQLTNTGKRQHFELGKYFRRRYGNFLGDYYNRSEFTIFSTDVDRTLMSAYSNLAGLFPPKGSQIWNQDLPWQPIPVHITQESNELLTNVPSLLKSCSAYRKLFECSLFSTETFSLLKGILTLGKQFLFQGNLTMSNVLKLHSYIDSIIITSFNNLSLPDWVTPKVVEESIKIRRHLFSLLVKKEGMRKLAGGRLLSSILTKFSMVENGADRAHKMFIYSAHDTNLIFLMGALNVLDPTPPFAATFILELHEQSGAYFVKTFYKNNTLEEPHPIVIPGCEASCPLEKLYKLTENVVVPNKDTFVEECDNSVLKSCFR